MTAPGLCGNDNIVPRFTTISVIPSERPRQTHGEYSEWSLSLWLHSQVIQLQLAQQHFI